MSSANLGRRPAEIFFSASFSLPKKATPLPRPHLSACHRFKPKNMTEDIFSAEILGHKLLPGATALSVGQSYKDFYVVGDSAFQFA